MRKPQFIIKYAGKYPVRVVNNVAGRVFELVSAERASRFPSEQQARQSAVDHGVKNFTIQPEQSLQLAAK